MIVVTPWIKRTVCYLIVVVGVVGPLVAVLGYSLDMLRSGQGVVAIIVLVIGMALWAFSSLFVVHRYMLTE